MNEISPNSARVAKNTFFLYFRMLLLMCIGLFTSRVILKQLGVEDYGIWTAVGGVVMIFTMVTDSVSQAIHRFLSFELGKKDNEKLKKVFSSGLFVMLGLSLVLVLLVLGVGRWFLEHRMSIPPLRVESARVVLYTSLGTLALCMFSVPFNAVIIAHERMGAFAALSIVEGVLKLTVALLLCFSSGDKLVLYAFLMLAITLIIRASYIFYCRRHFEETRTRLLFDKTTIKEMAGFASWSFIGSGANALNTHGLNLLSNVFFGVVVNAARGVASQVENIVRQFVTNFLTALNPQITKSWASNDREYCFELVRKGSKFAMLVVLFFLVPGVVETEYILEIWLGLVPENAALFTKLLLVALFVDVAGNSFMTLQLATGMVKKYYLWTGLCSLLCLPCVWVAFSLGQSAHMAYILLIAFYVFVFVTKILIIRRSTGFPVAKYLRCVLGPVALVAVLSLVGAKIAFNLVENEGLHRLVLVCLVSWLLTGITTYFCALTKGERAFIHQLLNKKKCVE